MPFVSVSLSEKLDQPQKEALKRGLGACISLIPGKTEGALMLDIADGRTMYFSGEQKPCAYIDVRIYGTASLEAKNELCAAFFDLIKEVSGLEADSVYISFGEYPNWGLRGIFK